MWGWVPGQAGCCSLPVSAMLRSALRSQSQLLSAGTLSPLPCCLFSTFRTAFLWVI